jgi:hypothetical protein
VLNFKAKSIDFRLFFLLLSFFLLLFFFFFFVLFSILGGGDRTRTRYLLLAKQPLSQLSYTPNPFGSVPGSTPATQAVNEWWVGLDSNQRPPPYQDGALTN